MENLHWSDPTSEEWLITLVECIAGAAILLLVTYRPGYRPAWLEHSYATQLALPRLTTDDSLELVQSVPQSANLPDRLQQEIVGKAAGNPFFLEELTRAVVEQIATVCHPPHPGHHPGGARGPHRPAPTSGEAPPAGSSSDRRTGRGPPLAGH